MGVLHVVITISGSVETWVMGEERNREGRKGGGREGGVVLVRCVHVCSYLSLCNHPVCIVHVCVVLCMQCKVFESEREPCRVVTLYTCLHLEPSQPVH